MTVGLTDTFPFFITYTVCFVRSTQIVVPVFFALQAEVLVPARRLATPLVTGPAYPATGRMSYRFWNFLIAAQSAADCLPSTLTDPKPPSFLRYPSTCF